MKLLVSIYMKAGHYFSNSVAFKLSISASIDVIKTNVMLLVTFDSEILAAH